MDIIFVILLVVQFACSAVVGFIGGWTLGDWFFGRNLPGNRERKREARDAAIIGSIYVAVLVGLGTIIK